MTPSPVRSFGPLNTGRVLAGTAFLMLPVGLLAPKGLAPLFVVAAAVVFILNFDAGRIRAVLRQPVALLLAAFLAVGALSAAWSIEAMASVRASLILSLTFFGGLYLIDTVARLDKRQRATFHLGILAGGILGLAVIAIEWATDSAISGAILTAKGVEFGPDKDLMPILNAGISVLAIVAWPWLLVIKHRFGAAMMAPGMLACGVVIFLGSADTPILALVTGFIVAALSLLARKAVLVVFTALMVIGVTVAPLVPGALPDPETETRAYAMLSNSAIHRLAIWRTAAEHISQNPVRGIGLNGTRFLYGDKDKIQRWYGTDDRKKKWGNFAEPIPLHAHNGVLQIWLELGGIGAVLFGGVLFVVMRRIGSGLDDGLATAARLGMLSSGIVIFSSSYGPWQGWWQGAIWLSVAVMAAAESEKTKA